MFEWPSPMRSASTGPDPSPCSSRKRSSGSRTISGSSSCSRASSGVSTTSAELIGGESSHAQPQAASMRKTHTMRLAPLLPPPPATPPPLRATAGPPPAPDPQAASLRKPPPMRLAPLPAPLPATLLALGATAGPAAAADVTIKNFAFAPAAVTINQGDSVTWTWAGPDTNHSVTSDPNQADSFDSDPDGPPTAADHLPGLTFAHTFNTSGTFTYLCKVHSFMTGKVVVNGPNGEPPPDTTAPAFSKVSASGGRKCKRGAKNCKAKPTTVRFTLSEDARVKLTVPKHPAANLTRSFKAGSRNVKLSVKKLPPGKYTVKLTATDGAGNA